MKRKKSSKRARKKSKRRAIEMFEDGVRKGLTQARKLVLLFRFLSKREKFALTLLKNYCTKSEYLYLLLLIKQKKAKVRIKKYGFSFMISGRDLLPIIISRNKFAKNLSKQVEERFYEEKLKDFAAKAWFIIPEFVSTAIFPKNQKRLLALTLLSNLKISLTGDKDLCRQVLKNLRRIAYVRLSNKPDITIKIKGEPAQNERFDKGDVAFLKEYFRKARKIEVMLPSKFNRFRKVKKELIQASARLELRRVAEQKDANRVKEIFSFVYRS